MATHRVKMAQKGQITIPKTLREQHNWDAGQQFSVIDLNGSIILNPRKSKVDVLADQLRDNLLQDGATLENMLAKLRIARAASL
jgi:AbrB family looped-hinge helix DNA binding protein